MAKHVKEVIAEEKEQSLQIQRGPRDLLDAWYPKTEPHIPLFYKASRVPRQRRVPREVPTPIAHSIGVPLAGLATPIQGLTCPGAYMPLDFSD